MNIQTCSLDVSTFIYPLFIQQGTRLREAIRSLPGVYRFSPDMLIEEIEKLQKWGIHNVLLFGIPAYKDFFGSSAYKDDSIITFIVRHIKRHFPDITIFTDICLCSYTTHGHCGILKDQKHEEKRKSINIDHDATLEILAKIALSHAVAGADYVAPSAMMPQQVRAIRHALDDNGYRATKIMGYSAKFASQFYGPFRDIADSAPQYGDRRTYQLDERDLEGALQKIDDDIKEGADIVMVKPSLAYLDVVRMARDKYGHTLAAYNVSGEYAMVKSGANFGWWDEKKMVGEIMHSIYRSGADIIITYHARDIAQWIYEGSFR